MKRAHKKLTSKSEPNRTYSVAVVATMSAGKSTLLNAMMWRRLLPSKSTACTSSVFSVKDRDGAVEFRMRARKAGGRFSQWKRASAKTLSEMNGAGFERIEIEGDLKRIANYKKRYMISFVDTPGPNNSCDTTHEQILREVMDAKRFSAVIMVLNATTLHTTDEQALLSELRNRVLACGNRTSVIFVLNRMDGLFHGKECTGRVADVVKRAQEHLANRFGFKNPVVIPTWASLSLACRELIAKSSPNLTLDYDDELELVMGMKKLFSHEDEIKGAWRLSQSRCFVRHRSADEELVDVLLPITGMRLSGKALLDVDYLTGIPLVERWAESHMRKHFESNNS